MIQEYINKVATEMAKKKDIWFLETLEKNGLIKSTEMTNMDMYWLSQEMGVRVVTTEKNITQVYIGICLVGEWHNNYEFHKEDENNYKTVAKCWN